MCTATLYISLPLPWHTEDFQYFRHMQCSVSHTHTQFYLARDKGPLLLRENTADLSTSISELVSDFEYFQNTED